jgi:Fe-S cluster assembly protein SufD
MSEATAAREPDFLAGFRELERDLAGRGPEWLRRLRRRHLERFERIGFPSVREEQWRNTNVAPIAATPFAPPPDESRLAPVLSGLAALDLGGPRLVLVDGRHDAQLSSGEAGPGVRLSSLANVLDTEPELVRAAWTRADPDSVEAFRALNHALATHTRSVVLVGRGARATLVESFVGLGAGAYLTNSITDLEIGADGQLDHYRAQLEAPQAFHVAHVTSRQDARSRYAACHASFGARLARNELRCELAGADATTVLDGLYMTIGDQHLDNQTAVDHAAPRCDSREVFKGALAGRSRGVFHGRIVVRPGAQQTDAKQSNPNLLLSPEALAQTRPQLEIRADDVKCTHGATIGRLDEDALFYLRSRGLAAGHARALLVEAFLGEILERVHVASLRRFLEQLVSERLAALPDGAA